MRTDAETPDGSRTLNAAPESGSSDPPRPPLRRENPKRESTQPGRRGRRSLRLVEDQPFPIKSRVLHKQWGKGVVEGYDGPKIQVVFEQVGSKKLSLEAVQRLGLLERAA